MASEIRVNKIENRSGLGTVTFADTGVDLAGIVTATTFSGSGASLTSLPAANITGTLPAISAANLTNVPAANITGTLPAISAANLTNIPAANLVGVCTSGLTKTGGFGKLVQVVQTVKKDVFSTTVTPGTVSGDITGLTLSITPTSASNKILIDCHVNGGFVGSTGMYVYLYKDGSVISDATGDAGGGTTVRASFQSQGGTLLDLEDVHGQYLDTAGGTSAITYSVRIQHPYTESSFAGTLYINRTGDADETKTNYVFPRTISTITAMEIAA